jgi:hypothetical protein
MYQKFCRWRQIGPMLENNSNVIRQILHPTPHKTLHQSYVGRALLVSRHSSYVTRYTLQSDDKHHTSHRQILHPTPHKTLHQSYVGRALLVSRHSSYVTRYTLQSDDKHHTSHFTPHTSHLTPHTSHCNFTRVQCLYSFYKMSGTKHW